jgi:hypothetical protein
MGVIERCPEQLLMVVVVLLIEAVEEELVGAAFELMVINCVVAGCG